MSYRFLNDGKDVIGDVVYGQQPQPTQPLLAGRFHSAEELEEAYMELQRKSDELNEQLRSATTNEFWGGS